MNYPAKFIQIAVSAATALSKEMIFALSEEGKVYYYTSVNSRDSKIAAHGSWKELE